MRKTRACSGIQMRLYKVSWLHCDTQKKREVEVEVTINFPIFRRRRVWFYSNDSKSLREADLEASFGSLYGYKSRPWNLGLV